MSNRPILLAIVVLTSSVIFSSSQQIQQNSWFHQEQNFDKLFAKFERLETKIRHQEFELKNAVGEIADLKKQVQRLESLLRLHNIQGKSENVAFPAVSYSPRTCLEALESGLPEYKTSGMYWIDPDGVGFGENSIYVYCDMTTGATLVRHDSELTISIPKCTDPGCYSRNIVYLNATAGQIRMLTELSEECRQSIRINCVAMPLTLDGVDYAWWIDKNNTKQIFWAGSNKGTHTCDCGLQQPNTCVETKLFCNCDSNVAVQLSDNGIITLKEVLPVTKLYFGGTSHTGGSHTLGRLECSGKIAASSDPKPHSCQDLWLVGYILNGIYPIQKDKKIEFVYCDFSTGLNVKDLRIGYIDVKSGPVHFTVQRKASFTQPVDDPNGAITFDSTVVNEGNDMDAETGIFTAPVSGTYVFDFSGVDLPGGDELTIDMYKDDVKIGSFYAANHGALAISSVLTLEQGNTIKLKLANSNGTLYGDEVNKLTHFTGFLLEEDILP